MGKTVVSGLMPKEADVYTFDIDANAIKKYLTTKFQEIGAEMRKRGQKIDDIKVDVVSERIGKCYGMVVLILPSTVLENDANANLPEVFNLHDGNGVIMKKAFYAYLKSLSFTKESKKQLYYRNWQDQVGIRSPREIKSITDFSIPKKHKRDGSTTVILAIDPIRLFRAMLTDVSNPHERFTICVSEVKKIEVGNAKFVVEKEIRRNRKNSNSKDILNLINSRK